MARYIFTLTNADDQMVDYLESTIEQDKLDIMDGCYLINFSGCGYLEFWKSCKNNIEDYKRRGYITETHTATISDTYTGDEKTWKVTCVKDKYVNDILNHIEELGGMEYIEAVLEGYQCFISSYKVFADKDEYDPTSEEDFKELMEYFFQADKQ